MDTTTTPANTPATGTYGEINLQSIFECLPDRPTNKYTLARNKRPTEDGSTLIIVNIFETDTGMAHGAVQDTQVFLGVDPRFIVQRVFQNHDLAVAYVRRYLENIANYMHRALELTEVDMSSGLYVPSRDGKLVRH